MIESPRTMPEQLLDEIAERTATCTPSLEGMCA